MIDRVDLSALARELTKAVDYADAYRIIRGMVQGAEKSFPIEDVIVRVSQLVELRDEILALPERATGQAARRDIDDLRNIALRCGVPPDVAPLPESEVDVQVSKAMLAHEKRVRLINEYSCALRQIDDILRGRETESAPWPDDVPTTSILHRARTVMRELNSAVGALSTRPGLPSGWQREERSEAGATWVRWHHPARGVDLELRLNDGGLDTSTLDVSSGVSPGELGAIMLIEAERGVTN